MDGSSQVPIGTAPRCLRLICGFQNRGSERAAGYRSFDIIAASDPASEATGLTLDRRLSSSDQDHEKNVFFLAVHVVKW